MCVCMCALLSLEVRLPERIVHSLVSNNSISLKHWPLKFILKSLMVLRPSMLQTFKSMYDYDIAFFVCL